MLFRTNLYLFCFYFAVRANTPFHVLGGGFFFINLHLSRNTSLGPSAYFLIFTANCFIAFAQSFFLYNWRPFSNMALISSIFLLAFFFLWKRKDCLSLTFFILCFLSISQDFLHVWRHVGNGERTTYEVFLFLILIFASSKRGRTIYLKLAFAIIFIFVFLYEFHFLTLSNHSRAGFNIFGRGLQSLLEIRHLF